MSANGTIDYTVRDLPVELDQRLREVAESEGIDLNTATVQAIERGLGGRTGPIRRRDLQSILDEHGVLSPEETQEWRDFLAEIDVVHPDDWK